MKISSIVPSYKRPDDLKRCLLAFDRQTRLPDELIVVVRDTDDTTRSLLDDVLLERIQLTVALVVESGVIAAMNRGIEVSSGEIITFTDDDAEPYPDWLETIESHYLEDDKVGAVGGKDQVYVGGKPLEGTVADVGRVSWFGRATGNHHLGTGAAREVDVLKGVNMSFRKSAMKEPRFDKRLRGSGAQVHFEMAATLPMRKSGWKIIYNPQLLVNHYPAQRFDEDQRNQFDQIAWVNEVHNETVALLEYLNPASAAAYHIWSTLVGTRRSLGIVQFLRLFPNEGKLACLKYIASTKGRRLGQRMIQKTSCSLSLD